VEQPRHGIVSSEVRPEGLCGAPQLAAVGKVDLKQPVARDDIALAEKGIRYGLGRMCGTP
jgi:hypothetical protein